jgi:glucokinase
VLPGLPSQNPRPLFVSNKKNPEKHSKFIGVDVGGTNVRAGLVQNGRILALQARPISSKAKQAVIVDEICQTIATILQPGVRGIGIGVPSLADVKTGIVYSVHNIRSWHAVPLKKILEQRFRLPVFVNNDANCFILGEFLFGMARGYRHIVGLVAGTGLGAGVVINGKLYSGNNGGAGEIGAIAYKGKNFEHFCSGQFFLREFGIDAATLQKRADGGDRKARAMFAAFGDHFAEVIMTLLYAYDPEIIVLGGSVNIAYPYFEKRMREKLRRFDFQSSLKKLVITQTKKPNIAVLGAAALCLDNQ